MKEFLEIGDKIKRWEVVREIEFTYEIVSVTKTLAKSKDGRIFFRKLEFKTTKPNSYYVAEIRCKEITSLGKRYFLINN